MTDSRHESEGLWRFTYRQSRPYPPTTHILWQRGDSPLGSQQACLPHTAAIHALENEIIRIQITGINPQHPDDIPVRNDDIRALHRISHLQILKSIQPKCR